MRDNYCVDDASVHLTGFSQGGMFAYVAAAQMDDVVASIVPIGASPLLGFGDAPGILRPVSVMDFHGTVDPEVPASVDAIGSQGPGPSGSVVSRLVNIRQWGFESWWETFKVVEPKSAQKPKAYLYLRP